MSTLKKQQHYIWKYYLKPWTTDNKIWCKRNNSQIFRSNPLNIGKKKFFYSSIKLTTSDKTFIDYYIKKRSHSQQETLKAMYDIYLHSISSDNYQNKCGIEDFHTHLEKDFEPILNQVYNNDFSFIKKSQSKMIFYGFIGHQYTKTKKIQDIISKSELEKYDLGSTAMSKVLPLLIGEDIALILGHQNNFQVLINKTEKKFITADQPIVQIDSNFRINNCDNSMELYYPISPEIALYFNTKEAEQRVITEEKEITHFNNLIINNSTEQIYALNQNDL